MRIPAWGAPYLAALRVLVLATLVLGLAYPLALTAVAHLPGLSGRAGGSIVERNGAPVASTLIGQAFTTGDDATPLRQYFQSRPSAGGYDPTVSGASNLGPESVVDSGPDDPSLLTRVCERSAAVGALEGVSGARPYCASDSSGAAFGAVLAVFRRDGLTGPVTRVVSVDQSTGAPFLATWSGVAVTVARPGEDFTDAVITPVRGSAPAHPAVPADAVTASGSGLDPSISPAYAELQVRRVAAARGLPAGEVRSLVREHTTGRALGFLGAPAVNVVGLNLALDRLPK